jgi:hypothetical protein
MTFFFQLLISKAEIHCYHKKWQNDYLYWTSTIFPFPKGRGKANKWDFKNIEEEYIENKRTL